MLHTWVSVLSEPSASGSGPHRPEFLSLWVTGRHPHTTLVVPHSTHCQGRNAHPVALPPWPQPLVT